MATLQGKEGKSAQTTLATNANENREHPVITNKPPKNTTLSMATLQGKDTSNANNNKTAPKNTSQEKKIEKEKEDTSPQTTPVTNEIENREDDPTSNNQSSSPDNTALHTGNEAEKVGKSPKTTPATNGKENGKEDKSTQTTPATNENENREDDPNSKNQSPSPENTALHTGNEAEKEGKTRKTTSATNKKKENGEEKKKKGENLSRDNKVHNSLLGETTTDKRKAQNTSALRIHIPGETISDGRTASSGNRLPALSINNEKIQENSTYKAPLPDIPTEKQQNQKNSTHQQNNFWYTVTAVEIRASSVVMGLKGIIMVATVVLISSSEEISNTKSCELEKALKSISLNYTVSCEYEDIKKISKTLRDMGISLLTLNLLFFLILFVFMLLPVIFKRVCILLPLIGIFSVFMVIEYNDILHSKILQKDMNYGQLQSAMAIWLEAHYTSDNISSSNSISNSWNKFFIEYDCCAVNQVQGTTNDFDSTPWCTTLGTCQSTASQIPKTCCNYMTEDDYGSAPSACHSSVNPGTFRSNCMNVIKQLSTANVEECQLSLLQMSLIIIAILELVATAFEITTIIICIILWGLGKPKSKNDDNENKSDLNKAKSKKEDKKKRETIKRNRNGENKQEK